MVSSQLLDAGHEEVVFDDLSKGHRPAIPEGADIEAVEAQRRPGDPPVLVASSEKIKDELGWVPEKLELSDMISDAWEWMRNHPRGYKG